MNDYSGLVNAWRFWTTFVRICGVVRFTFGGGSYGVFGRFIFWPHGRHCSVPLAYVNASGPDGQTNDKQIEISVGIRLFTYIFECYFKRLQMLTIVVFSIPKIYKDITKTFYSTK